MRVHANPRRRIFHPEVEVRFLREHPIEGRPVSEVCDASGLRPTQPHQWQAVLVENGAAAFRKELEEEVTGLRERIEESQARPTQKDRRIAEVFEELVTAMQSAGAI